jgi:Arc/MetJ-type ribon-helix-helix transcriptional regulator
MAIGMATTKVTITLEDDQIEAVRRIVASGKATSVSGFVKHAVAVALDDAAGWATMLGAALKASGGPLTNKERAWADSILRPKTRSKRKRKAA